MSAPPTEPRPWRRVLAWNLTLAVAAASGLVFCARDVWVGELVASFEWHVGWCAVFLSMALLALRFRSGALVAATLGALHVAPEARLYLPPAHPLAAHRTGAPRVRIASANLLQPNHHHGAVAAALARTQADVIAVLELSGPMREVLERELADWPYRVYSPARPSAGGTWSLGLFSRRPLSGVRLEHLRDCYAPAIEARVDCAGRSIVLRVVHLPRPGEECRVRARNGALRQLADAFDWSPRSVLVGDLNTTSSSPAFAPLCGATGLRDSRQGFGRQPTWWLRSLSVPLAIAIDHVLVGASVDVVARWTFEVPHSDHAGVLVDLALH